MTRWKKKKNSTTKHHPKLVQNSTTEYYHIFFKSYARFPFRAELTTGGGVQIDKHKNSLQFFFITVFFLSLKNAQSTTFVIQSNTFCQ